MIIRSVQKNAIILGLFALLTAATLAAINNGTQTRIAENERRQLEANLFQLVPPEEHDNDMLHDTLPVKDPLLGYKKEKTAWIARQQGRASAVILPVAATEGYNGTIHLLVGVRADGTLAGVRAISHKETPGLGDRIDLAKTDWILSFDNLSLDHPAPEFWAVKKDGGHFDSFTGATITPRAVVKAVKQALLFAREHHERLFAPLNPLAPSGEATPHE